MRTISLPARRIAAAAAMMLALQACTATTPAAYSPAASEAVYTNLLAAPAVKPSVAGALKYAKVNGVMTLVGENGKPVQYGERLFAIKTS